MMHHPRYAHTPSLGTRYSREAGDSARSRGMDYGETSPEDGAHQGLKKGLRDYRPLTGQDELFPGIHCAAGTGSVHFQSNPGEAIILSFGRYDCKLEHLPYSSV